MTSHGPFLMPHDDQNDDNTAIAWKRGPMNKKLYDKQFY